MVRLHLLIGIASLMFLSKLSGDPVSQYECSHTYLGRLRQGFISSYNYPFDYRENLTCIYRIYLDNLSERPKTVCFLFRVFSLESSSPFCSFDYLEVGFSPPIKYCGVGLWQYGVEEKGNILSNVWSRNLCWTLKNGNSSVRSGNSFDLMFSSDNSVNGSGFSAVYQVFNADEFKNSMLSTTTGQAPCRTDEWTCANRKCILRTQLCNGRDDCGDSSDESYAFARCRGQNLLACDFSDDGSDQYDYCQLTHEGWNRSSGSHPGLLPGSNGPRGDHTNGTNGYYIYSVQSPSYLVSPQLSLNINTTYCLHFWYYVYGDPLAVSLSTYVSHEQAYSRAEWTMSTSTGMARLINSWRLAEVFVGLKARPLQVVFAAETGGGVSGIALDDISLMEGECSGVDIQCNFESSFCGWESVPELIHKTGSLSASQSWLLQSRRLAASGSLFDHSSTDGSGNYLYTSFMRNSSASGTSNSGTGHALLLSPAISALPGEHMCLSFWYYMDSSSDASCGIQILLHKYDNRLSDDIWNQSVEELRVWNQALIDFEADGPLQVVIDAHADLSKSCSIAMDQLKVEKFACSTESYVHCNNDQFRCADNECIDLTQKCDGVTQCTDGSDEDWHAECPVTDLSVDTVRIGCDGFLCPNSSICIRNSWLCDMFNDCGDSADEGPLAGCSTDMYTSYVKPTWTSDVDTTEVTTYVPEECLTTDFSCESDGICIPSTSKCNGIAECDDSSDEFNCSVSVVPPVELICAHSYTPCSPDQVCLSSDQICDGKNHCSDGSDERNCHSNSSVKDWLNSGAMIGIILGCCLCLLIFLIIAIVARRRHKRKRCPVRRTMPPPTLSSIATIYNSDSAGTIGMNSTNRDVHALNSRRHLSQQQMDRNNMAYIEESSRDFSQGTSRLLGGEDAPPSYSSVLRDTLQQRATIFPSHERIDDFPDENVVDSPDEFPNEFTRRYSGGKGSYRSLPPTPVRQPNIPPLLATMLQQPHHPGHPGLTPGRGDTASEHIYEEPSSLLLTAPVNCSRLSSNPGNFYPDAHQKSFVISPTLPSQRTSRIRLGTTALQARSNSIEGQADCSSMNGRPNLKDTRHLSIHHPSNTQNFSRSRPPFNIPMNDFVSNNSARNRLSMSASCQFFPNQNNTNRKRKESNLKRSGTNHSGHQPGMAFSADIAPIQKQPSFDKKAKRPSGLTSMTGYKLPESNHLISYPDSNAMPDGKKNYEQQHFLPSTEKQRRNSGDSCEISSSSPLVQAFCGDEFLNPTCV